MGLKIKCPSFENEHEIPEKYTCDGEDISPELKWSGLPEGTKSLALIVDDPDAPEQTYVHWVVYNIPPWTKGLEEGIETLPNGADAGLNDWHKSTYGGPCPPIGRHRYFFKLYALDTVLSDLKIPSKVSLEKKMKDHIIEKTVLMGTYKR